MRSFPDFICGAAFTALLVATFILGAVTVIGADKKNVEAGFFFTGNAVYKTIRVFPEEQQSAPALQCEGVCRQGEE